MALNLQHQTPAQFAARFRESFRSSEKVETYRLATKLMNWLDSGDITDTQARNAFGLTLTQWNNLKTRLTAMRTRYAELQSAGGE
jgi:hypothetical protein